MTSIALDKLKAWAADGIGEARNRAEKAWRAENYNCAIEAEAEIDVYELLLAAVHRGDLAPAHTCAGGCHTIIGPADTIGPNVIIRELQQNPPLLTTRGDTVSGGADA